MREAVSPLQTRDSPATSERLYRGIFEARPRGESHSVGVAGEVVQNHRSTGMNPAVADEN